jgi:hypothetical protein
MSGLDRLVTDPSLLVLTNDVEALQLDPSPGAYSVPDVEQSILR